jgi:ATP-dependent Clp protease ATP-binding subunit ClpA
VVNRYTQESRLVFHYAREEQHLLRHSDLVNAEHILLGVLRDPKVYTALLEFGCTLEAVRSKIQALQGVSATPWNGTVPHIATETRHLMKLASSLARASNEQVIEPSHILLAILEQPSSLAYQVLTSFATPEQIRSAIAASSG